MRIEIDLKTEGIVKVAAIIFVLVFAVAGTIYCTGKYLVGAKQQMTSVQYRPVIRETFNNTITSEPVIVKVDASKTDCIRINGRKTSECDE